MKSLKTIFKLTFIVAVFTWWLVYGIFTIRWEGDYFKVGVGERVQGVKNTLELVYYEGPNHAALVLNQKRDYQLIWEKSRYWKVQNVKYK